MSALVGEEKVKMLFAKLKLPGEQTKLTEKRESNVRTIKRVHSSARQIRNFDANAQPVKFFNSI